MAKSQFNESLLEPVDEKSNKSASSKGWNKSLLEPIDSNEEQYLAPKEEGVGTWLPRDILSGLASLGHNNINLPHDIVQNLEQQGQKFNDVINKSLPIDKYIEKNTLPGSQSMMQDMVNKFNAEHNVPKSLQNKDWNKSLSERIPHQQEYDFAQMLGQNGNPSTRSLLIQKGIEYAPEILGIGQLAKHLTPQRIKDIFGHNVLNKKITGIESEVGNAEKALTSIEDETAYETKQADFLQNKANKEIGGYLNEGANHGVRAATSLSHRIGQVENYWKSSYKNLKDKLKNSEFQMEELPKYEQDLNHVIKNIKDLEVVNGRFVIKNQPELSSELQSIINKAPTTKDTAAGDFLTKYQDFRDARYDLLQRAKTAGSASERKALFEAYEKSKPIEESVSKALNKGLGPHQEEFKRVNKGYSNEVYPLRNNKVSQKALQGKLGPNTMEDLSGSGEGQELIREMVKQDPELLRNIVGQRYAAKPESLKNINETTAEYLYEMPELKKIMTAHESSINKQLNKVNELKNKKEITLKQKLDLESHAKELKQKLNRIKNDRSKIWKGTKKAAKYGTASLYLGGNFLNKLIGK